MVTVIATSKEELITPKHDGVTGGDCCDNERTFQFIKDYQEVDFSRSASCKPLPEDCLDFNTGFLLKSSIQGTYFLQIDAIEPFIHNPMNQLLLTLTDGYVTVQALTNHFIPNLNLNTKVGSKLLLTDTIAIENNYLQLTSENTTFKYGSSTYPRPRSAYRNRGNGSTRPNTDGRRNSQYDNETNFFKRPPPKTTLMDFITTLKISNDVEPEKTKERTDSSSKRSSNGNNHQNPIQILEQDGFDEQLDVEDDPTQANQRERRNPLPPRLQRAQEERTRRNPTRYFDESNPTMSSYSQLTDPSVYPYTNSIPNHLIYYPTPLPYNLPNQQTLLASNDQMNLCCGYSYSTYPSTNSNGEKKTNGQNHENGEKTENDNTNSDGKRRNAHQRPRWKINDMCSARWNEDGEFYYATIVDIQPPYCTVLFVDYNTYDQVHFNDLKLIPADQQQFYPFVPPTDLNLFATNGYFPARANYYPPTLDGCVIMPEAPPFPFNSAGTLYMYPPDIYSTQIQSNEFFLNSSTSPPSKDSNDTSTNDSAEDQQQQHQLEPTSIADAPLILVTSNETAEQQQQQQQQENEEDQ